MLTLATWGKGIPFTTLVSQDHLSTSNVSAQIKLGAANLYLLLALWPRNFHYKTSDCNCSLQLRNLPLSKVFENNLILPNFGDTYLRLPCYPTSTYVRVLPKYDYIDYPLLTCFVSKSHICQTSTRSLAVSVMGTATAQFPRANLSRYSQHLRRRTRLRTWCH